MTETKIRVADLRAALAAYHAKTVVLATRMEHPHQRGLLAKDGSYIILDELLNELRSPKSKLP